MTSSAWNRCRNIFIFLTDNRFILTLLLSLICLRIYLPELLGHEFVDWDDHEYILNNPIVKGLTSAHIIDAFTSSYFSNYAPLHLLSYMVDFHLWGNWLQGYLLENLIIHWINGLLLFQLLARTTASRTGAFFGSLVFLIHPVQIESVAWASERKNLLAMFFFLIAFHAYLYFDHSGWKKGWSFYSLSLLMLACALLTKSIAVIFPVAVLLYDFTIGRDSLRNWKLLEKIPFITLTIAAALMTVIAQDPVLNEGIGGMYDFFNGNRTSAFLTMTTVFFSYLKMLIHPSDLSILYDPKIRNEVDLAVTASLIGIGCIMALFAIMWRKEQKMAFWGGIFILGLLPVSQVVPLCTLMNDRYLYFPMIGIAGGIATMYCKLALKNQATEIISCLMLLVFTTYLADASIRRLPVWKNSLSLWSDAVIKSPEVPTVWIKLGTAHKDQGEFEEGRTALSKAVKMIPRSPEPLYELARLEAKAGRADQAISLLEQAVRLGYKKRSDLNKEKDFNSIRLRPEFGRLYRYFYLLQMIPGYRINNQSIES